MDQAEFDRWRPGMAGKRNWSVIRKFLLEAAEAKTIKGTPLLARLYLPETFSLDREEEIDYRRIAFMTRAVGTATDRRQPLLLLIGEVKSVAPGRLGYRLIVKHVPKFPFLLKDDAYRRMTTKFASELSMWETNSGAHLIILALDPNGVATIDSMALMIVTENWIPFEHQYEGALLEALTRRSSSFVKGLRYDLPIERPLASVFIHKIPPSPLRCMWSQRTPMTPIVRF